MSKSLKDQLAALKKVPAPVKPAVPTRASAKPPPPKQPKKQVDPERALGEADRYFRLAMDAPDEPTQPVAKGAVAVPVPSPRALADAEALAELSEWVAAPRRLDVQDTERGPEALAPGADPKLLDLLRAGVFPIDGTISSTAELAAARRKGHRVVNIVRDRDHLLVELRTVICGRLVLAAAGSLILLRR